MRQILICFVIACGLALGLFGIVNDPAHAELRAVAGGITQSGSTAWSSLTAPTANNSVTATVDTSQTLLGHFDTSGTAKAPLFSLGEDIASTRAGSPAANAARVFNISTLSGSTALPLVISAFGFSGSAGTAGNFFMSATGSLTYVGNSDSVTGNGGTNASFTAGASASGNAAGSIILNGGANSSTGAGGNITLTPGTSTSGTAGTNILAGPTQLGSGTLATPTGGLGITKITADATAPGAAGAKLELVCGTNAGSAKIIAYAGTSTTPVTIVDNIGSGVTGC